jgi:hypothetical protein
MFHPDILRAYMYLRTQCETNAIDACTDTAEHNRAPVSAFARFLITMGIDAQPVPHGLQLLA